MRMMMTAKANASSVKASASAEAAVIFVNLSPPNVLYAVDVKFLQPAQTLLQVDDNDGK